MIPIGERVLMQVWWVDATNVAGGWHDTDALDDFVGNGAWECSNTGWLVHEDELSYVLAGRMTDDGSNVGLVERIPKSAVTRLTVFSQPQPGPGPGGHSPGTGPNGVPPGPAGQEAAADGQPDEVFGEFRRVPTPVPGFEPGDKVWPKTGSTMTLQTAPQTVWATHYEPGFGDWLWLDPGGGRPGSWTAENWTTEEPGEAEKASRAARAQERAEESARSLRSIIPQGEVIFVPARDGLTPYEIRAVQDRLNDVAADLAIEKFIVLPPGAIVLPPGSKMTGDPQPAGLYPLPLDTPSGEDDPGDSDDTGRCAECNMPLTMHHDIGCSQPCGRCAEAEAKRPPLLELPLHMKQPRSTRRVRAQPGWEEAFPGLQVRGIAVGQGKGGGLAYDLEFRLTPEDGATAAAEAEDRVTVSLPAYMSTGHQLAGISIDGEWCDVFPGSFQARFALPFEPNPGGAYVLDFRLTPPGEEQAHG